MTVLAEGLINEVGGMPSLLYGVIAFVLFIACAIFVWSFRNVANRHAAKAEAWAKANPEHASALNELGEPKRAH